MPSAVLLRRIFAQIDTSGDGFISADELREALISLRVKHVIAKRDDEATAAKVLQAAESVGAQTHFILGDGRRAGVSAERYK